MLDRLDCDGVIQKLKSHSSFQDLGPQLNFGTSVWVEFAVAAGGEPVSNDLLVMNVITTFTPLLSQVPNPSQFKNEESAISWNPETGSEANLRIE